MVLSPVPGWVWLLRYFMSKEANSRSSWLCLMEGLRACCELFRLLSLDLLVLNFCWYCWMMVPGLGEV